MIEDWRAIPGYEGLYEVSNQGRVRSLDRYDNIGRFININIKRELFPGVEIKTAIEGF